MFFFSTFLIILTSISFAKLYSHVAAINNKQSQLEATAFDWLARACRTFHEICYKKVNSSRGTCPTEYLLILSKFYTARIFKINFQICSFLDLTDNPLFLL